MAKQEPMRGKLKTAPADAPEYLVTKTSIIDGRQANRGSTVRYAGIPGKFLRPIDAAGKAIVAKVAGIRKGEGIDKAIAGEDRTRMINDNLRALSDELLQVVPKDEFDDEQILRDAGIDTAASSAERKEWEAQAKHTKEQYLEQQQDAGGVLVQLTGSQPSTVVPTTGPLADATDQEKKAATEALKGKSVK